MDTKGLIEPGAVAIRLAGEVVIQSRTETLGGATLGGQRAKIALARLAVEAGSTVPRGILAEAIWADHALAFSEAGAASEELMIDDGLLDLYEEAIAALGARDPDRRAALLGRLASAYAWRRSGTESRRAADEALALARELGEDATVARVLTAAPPVAERDCATRAAAPVGGRAVRTCRATRRSRSMGANLTVAV
jgi:hypothetical protein